MLLIGVSVRLGGDGCGHSTVVIGLPFGRDFLLMVAAVWRGVQVGPRHAGDVEPLREFSSALDPESGPEAFADELAPGLAPAGVLGTRASVGR